MSKYDKVRELLGLVARDTGHFDFSVSDYCVVGIGFKHATITYNDAFEETLSASARCLGISPRQAEEIYCGHITMRHMYETGTDDESIYKAYSEHKDRMLDKALCINYVLGLIETWEAVDRAASDHYAVVDRAEGVREPREECDA